MIATVDQGQDLKSHTRSLAVYVVPVILCNNKCNEKQRTDLEYLPCALKPYMYKYIVYLTIITCNDFKGTSAK